MANDSGSIRNERRVHHAVRKVFMQACALLAPLVRDNGKALNASSFAMLHVVQDHFPGLSASEAHIVISTVKRLHHENRLQSLLEQWNNDGHTHG